MRSGRSPLKRRGPEADRRPGRGPRSRDQASHRRAPSKRCATRSGSSKWVVASTIARARPSRVLGLEDPGAHEVALGPQLHHQRGVGRGGDAAGAEQRHRKPAAPGDVLDHIQRSLMLLRGAGELLRAQRGEVLDAVGDLAHVPDGLDDVAGARLALGADHRGALADAPQRLAEVGGSADEGNLEGELVDVIRLVRGRQHLRLVHVVDLEGLRAPVPRRSGRCGPWPSPGSSPSPGSP